MRERVSLNISMIVTENVTERERERELKGKDHECVTVID